MPALLKSTSAATSQTLYVNQTITASAQLAVEGTGAVSAQAVLEGSHDQKGWINIATLNASGTSYAADGGPFQTLWPYMRVRVVSVSGGEAIVYVELGR